MLGMTFNPQLSIEGIATALSVAGAAAVFIYGFIRKRLEEIHEKRMVGTSFVIIDMLEQATGTMRESELYGKYTSGHSEAIIEKYKAMPARKLDRVAFERRLRSLQFDSIIAPVGRDEWRLVLRPVPSYEVDDAFKLQLAALLSTTERRNRVVNTVTGAIDSLDGYDLTRALRLLMRFSPQEANATFERLLDKGTHTQRLAVCEVLAELPISHVSAPPSSP